MKTTRVNWNTEYIFQGPLILFVCTLFSRDIDQVDFSGFGLSTMRNVGFRHEFLFAIDNPKGSFSTSDGIFQGARKLSVQYTTFVLSPNYHPPDGLSEPQQLAFYVRRLNSSETDCMEHTTFTIQFDHQDHNSADENTIDCCQVNCKRKKFTIFKDPVMFTFISPIPSRESFLVFWNFIPPVTFDTCGEIDSNLGSGTIAKHKSASQNRGMLEFGYGINERCIWLIRPNALVSKTAVHVPKNALEENHDHLIAMGIGGQNGLGNIKRLEEGNTYVFKERIILVLFTSDDSRNSEGFHLNWTSTGNDWANIDNLKYNDKIYHINSLDSSLHFYNKTTMTQDVEETSSWPGDHVFLINPMNMAPYSLDLYLQYRIKGAVEFCLFSIENGTVKELNVWKNVSGIEHELREHFGNYNSWDVVFIIVVKFLDRLGNFEMSFEYSKGKSTVPPTHEECGGAVSGDFGMIAYKHSEAYFEQERCIWTLICPQQSEIKLKLLKHNFAEKDYLLINEIEKNTKNLTNKTVTMRDVRETSIHGSLLFITFVSSNTEKQRRTAGFVLSFNCSGQANATSKRFIVYSSTADEGRISFPVNQVFSNDEGNMEASIQKYIYIFTNGNLPHGARQAFNERSAQPVELLAEFHLRSGSEYQLFEEDSSLTIYSFWDSKYEEILGCTFLSSNATFDHCSGRLKVDKNGKIGEMILGNTGILGIYRPPLMFRSDPVFGLELTWKNYSPCGGVLRGEGIGQVNYDVNNTSNFFCTWIIEVPGDNLELYLISYDFIPHVDRITVAAIIDGMVNTPEFLPTSSTFDSPFIISTPGHIAILSFFTAFNQDASFRLRYISSPPIKEYLRPRLIHTSSRIKSNFSIPSAENNPMEVGKTLVILVDDLPKTGRPTVRNQIDKLSLDVMVDDGGKCIWDTLVRYEQSYSKWKIGKSYRPMKTSRCAEENGDDDNVTKNPSNGCNSECYGTDILPGLNPNPVFRVPFMIVYHKKTNITRSSEVPDFKLSVVV